MYPPGKFKDLQLHYEVHVVGRQRPARRVRKKKTCVI
jgi:hypothetical protein